jgi:hypothetical protein
MLRLSTYRTLYLARQHCPRARCPRLLRLLMAWQEIQHLSQQRQRRIRAAEGRKGAHRGGYFADVGGGGMNGFQLSCHAAGRTQVLWTFNLG